MSDNPEQIKKDRNMIGKPIGSTYKGILRVSNNINLIDDNPDLFFSKKYYANSDEWTGNGINSTYSFLMGDESVTRFKTNDIYTNLKLPVTDSMGNYLNFSLGVDGSVVGSDIKPGNIRVCEEQFNENDTVSFPAITTNITIAGLSPYKSSENKTEVGADLKINSSSEQSAQLVINNHYRHGSSGFVPKGNNEQIRTIYTTKPTAKKFDAFVYNQENYSLVKDENSIRKDCYVTLENLRDYVYDKVANYLKSNNSEVATGTIISQYCDLSKWFCVDTGNNTPDDFNNWQGYRPAMYSSGNYAYYNVIQGKACKAGTYLYYNGDSAEAMTSELPPDFKRGYVLCNGDGYTIQLYPSNFQGVKNSQLSLDLFFNLFYTIGYYYHNDKKGIDINTNKDIKQPPAIRDVKKINGKYRFINLLGELKTPTRTVYAKADPDIVYAIDMASILVFKALNDKFASTNAHNFKSVEDVLDWLKGQKIPDEYVFNAIFPENNNFYNYNTNSFDETIKINIGREVNSFNSKIPYYYEENEEWKIAECEIYNTAEAYDMARLFLERRGEADWDAYNFTFYVPQLYTYTDPDVNIAYKYKNNLKSNINVSIGQFIGSNGLLIADKVTLAHKDGITIETNKNVHSFECNYVMSQGYYPHSHGVAKGKLALKRNHYSWYVDTENRDTSNSRAYKLSPPNISSNNTISDNEYKKNEHIITADYMTSPWKHSSSTALSNDLQTNYLLQEVQEFDNDNNELGDIHLVHVYDQFNGMYGLEYQNTTSGNHYDWYGRTSEPIWSESKTDLSNYTDKFTEGYSDQGYFRPESIKLMPLIKL